MRRLLVPLTLALCSGSAADAAQSGAIFPYKTHVETLDNGLQVILVPMSSGGLLAYWTVVRTGSRDEYEPGHTGFAHFFEHMMFRGTEKFPSDVYNNITTKMGADANASTSDDLTAYHLGLAKEDLEKVMEIESDRFQNLSYAEPAFQTEAGAVYGEYRKDKTDPFFTLEEALHKVAFGTHTYSHTAMGFEADIKAMPKMYDYSKSFFARYYRPENCVLVIAGELDVPATMALARQYYGGWKRGYVEPRVPVEPPQTEERHLDVPYPGKSLPILWLAYKADRFDPTDRTYVAGTLLAELAFGETSEIHKKLVLDEQVAEFIEAEVTPNRDPGLFDVLGRIKDPAKVDYVRSEIERVIDGCQLSPPDAARLADLKSRLKYSFLMNLDTPDHVAQSLARIIAVTGGIRAIDQLYTTYDSITPQDVQAAARKYLVRERRTVAVLRGEK